MLRLQNLTLARGTRVLYKGVTLSARPGEKIGLVGPNGSGKSTLFAAVIGEITSEAGDIGAPEPLKIAHVAQRMKASDEKALDFVLSGHQPLMQAKQALEEAEASGSDMEYAHALSTLTELNEGAITARALEILNGLGFKPGEENKQVQEFSGGWRNRLALARALITPSELLLLDEPTNHLDLDSVIWLENWLRGLDATVLIISHDREFLDKATETIWSIEDGTINAYTGNFTDFERMRAEKVRQQAAAAKAYAITAAHLKSYIERFRYKATKAKQAQSRIKMLERLESIEPVHASYEWRFNFLDPEKVPDHLIFAEDLFCGYGQTNILHDVKVRVEPGDRIGVLGVNGAGKSTLIKTLTGNLEAQSGDIRTGQGLRIGYFAQHQLDELREDETPLQHLARLAPEAREQELRNYLGKFKFTGDMALSPTGPMSGGEKARLSLALLAWNKPNLLVLDEPTNHLDMQTREALTAALSSFEGAVLLVSHDRHLLRAACDDLWLVHDGEVSEFNGDLDDYASIVLEHAKAAKKGMCIGNSGAPATSRKEQKRLEAEERNRKANLKKPLLKELAKVEASMEKTQKELDELNSKLAEEGFYSQPQAEIAKVVKRQGELSSLYSDLETKWLEISEEIESIS